MRVLFRRAVIALVAVLLVASLAVDTETARAANSNINHRSPSPDISDNNNSWHNLILSNNFGKVQDIEAGVYFPDENSTLGRNIRFEVLNDPLAPSADKCNIPGAAGYNLTNTYVVIQVGTGPDAKTETVTGNQICNGNLDGRVFHIPKAILDANKPGPAVTDTGFRDSGLTGANVSIRWVNSNDEGAPDDVRSKLARANGNDGHSFRFRIIAHNGPNYPGDASGCGVVCAAGEGNAKDASVGFIGTNSSSLNNPNNSIVFRGGHKGPGDEYNKFSYTFGLSCAADDTKFNQEVKLYDVDNGVPSTQPRPASFYVGRIDSEGKVTPLRTGEYSSKGEGGATRLNDIDISEYSTHSFDRDNLDDTDLIEVAQSNNNTPHNTSDDFDYPLFYPSNFHNFGGETKVKVHRVEPRTRYVVVVDMVHRGQYIYSGLPGDAIFGSPTYDHARECPPPGGPHLQPFVSLSKSEYEIGEAPTANAWIDKTGSRDVGIDTTRQFWYETSTDWDQNTRRQGSETLIHENLNNHWDVTESELQLPVWTAGQFPVPGPGGRIPNPAAPANARYVCTLLELRNPTVPTATIDTPNPAVSCAKLKRSPYFRVNLGDVNAAAGWGSPCTSSGRISAFNLGAGSGFQGSGAQVAAFSVGVVEQFASGRPAKGLTFANTTSDEYGGGFNGTNGAYCIEDYLEGVTNNSLEIIDGTETELVTKTKGNAIVRGSKIVNNIDVGDVPNLQWVIADNIYIDANVAELHGIYIARNNIYTCSDGVNPINIAQNQTQFNRCNRALTIRGALVAGGNLKLMRTLGSLVGPTPAETIQYNPFVWFSAISNQDLPPGGGTVNKFDYITALPPVL